MNIPEREKYIRKIKRIRSRNSKRNLTAEQLPMNVVLFSWSLNFPTYPLNSGLYPFKEVILRGHMLIPFMLIVAYMIWGLLFYNCLLKWTLSLKLS